MPTPSEIIGHRFDFLCFTIAFRNDMMPGEEIPLIQLSFMVETLLTGKFIAIEDEEPDFGLHTVAVRAKYIALHILLQLLAVLIFFF